MRKVVVCFIMLTMLFTACTKERMVTGNAEINWVDFIKVKGITYVADFDKAGFEIDKSEIGKEYSKVKYKVSNNVHNPSYETQDGDAAFLEVGTKIYKLKGYKADCRLAIIVNDEIRIYDADYNPDAIKGKDLLDIREKVQYIDVLMEDEKGSSEIFKINELDNINELVNYIMDANVDYNKQYSSGNRYFLNFCLIDNTRIRKCYFINDNYLNPGIVLSESFKEDFLNSLE